MADGEEVTLDGRPLQALRVADLKAALEQRGLPKSGQKSALIKRLRGHARRRSTVSSEENSKSRKSLDQNSVSQQFCRSHGTHPERQAK